LAEKIRDGQFLRLISHMLRAGYLAMGGSQRCFCSSDPSMAISLSAKGLTHGDCRAPG
jgi:hypothetical protein